MRFPMFLALFLTFLGWLSVELRKSSRRSASRSASFWKREAEANRVRKQTLDNLDYITIPVDSLPFFYGIDEKLDDMQETIKNLASRKIVNLSSLTNTELKLQYGAANLPALTEYDQNFTILVRTLYRWGQRFADLGYETEAIQVLEFSISIHSDVTAGYLLLGKLYLDQGMPSKLDTLIDSASELDSLLKDSLLRQLHSLSGQSQAR